MNTRFLYRLNLFILTVMENSIVCVLCLFSKFYLGASVMLLHILGVCIVLLVLY